jgi:hypothetical protein
MIEPMTDPTRQDHAAQRLEAAPSTAQEAGYCEGECGEDRTTANG